VSSSIPSPRSSSSAEPTLSVVIGSNAPQALSACLEALEPQHDGNEILVYEGLPSSEQVRQRFPWARFVERPNALVPELWRDGIDASTGDVVVLTISQMVPAEDWLDSIRTAQRRFGAIGGAIEPGDRLRLVDWAEYFCRYARDMLPFAGRETVDLPGDNAAYKRALLDATKDLFRDGFWEPVVHHRLEAQGVTLWQDPAVVVHQGRSAGWRAFADQRLRHGRAYGHQRGEAFTRNRALIGIAASPLIPFLMTLRVLKLVFHKRRNRRRALMAAPAIFWFNAVWAFAESRGYLDVARGRS
jgi:hypothetical protein